jgi:protein TonB
MGMLRMTRRLGFGLSLLVHGGLLAGLWAWQQQRSDSAVPGDVVPVQMAMFAEAPPAPTPLVPPQPVAEPVEPAVEQEVTAAPAQPVESTVPPPVARKKPLPHPANRPAPRTVPETEAVERQPVAESEPVETAPQPVPPATPSAAAPRTAQRVQLREAYKAALLAAIEQHKFYPNRARRRRIEGQARVGFRITADGRIERIRLVGGSGVTLLDQAALQTLERLGRAAPLPPALGMDHWDLVVPIDFRLL